jgi:hypothetical protein
VKLSRNNTLMLNLTAFSLVALLFLVGLFLYSGSILPGTQGASSGEAALMWSVTALAIGLPIITGVLWILRWTSKAHNSPDA